MVEQRRTAGPRAGSGTDWAFYWNVQEGALNLSVRLLSIYGIGTFDGRYDTWLKSIHREDQVRVTALLDETFVEQRREAHLEFRIIRDSDNKLKWLESRYIITYDEQGSPARAVGVTIDVTERKQSDITLRAFTETLEEAVRERTRELVAENEARKVAEESLRQSQKMEAVGQLTGGVAHDFNNLLTIVVGGLDMIGRHIQTLPPSAAVSRIIRAKDMALEGVRRATTLTNRLLAFSRQQPLAPEILDPNKLVAGICELLRRTLGETVSLETVLAGGLWRTEADTNQLENAILNLAVNARDAMPDGGKVTIETANCSLDSAYVASLSEPVEEGQYVMISVADTGLGMDRATLERAFDPFYTTKEVGKGTGLGLSQVYGFVRQSAGHVKIYSELGQGTTVKIYLRRCVAHDDREAATAVPLGVIRAIGSEKILVVEDDDWLREYSADILRELGYTVLGAANGATALEALDRNDIDLLFTDVVMPGGINGRQLADEALRRKPGLKVLFTTGYTRNAIVHHGRLDPGVHMIGKPFTFDELGAKVRSLLDG